MAAVCGSSRRIRYVEILCNVSSTVWRTLNSFHSVLVVLAGMSTVALVRWKPSSTGLRMNRASYYGTSCNCGTRYMAALGTSTLSTVGMGVGCALLGWCGWLMYIVGNIGPDTMDIDMLLRKPGLLDSNITVGMSPYNTVRSGSLGIELIFALDQ